VFDSGFSLNNTVIAMTGSSATGALTIQGSANVTTKYVNVGNGGSNSGRIDQTAGTLTLLRGGTGFRLGHWNNNSTPANQYNLSGGLLDATDLSGNAGSARLINIGWDGTGMMVVGGGASAATLKAFGIQLDANGNGGGNDGGNNTLTVSANGAVEVGAGGIGSAATGDVLVLNGGSVKSTANASWSALINANDSTTSVLDANGFTVTLTGSTIGGAGTINLSAATGTVALSTNGTQTVAASFSGSTPMTKAGSGTTTLSGTNTHTGSLAVTAGRLNVAAGGSVTSTSTSVASGATLGGEGSIAGTVTPAAGSRLAVDPVTAGSIAFNNLDLTGQPTIAFETTPIAAQSPVRLFAYTGTLTSPGGLSTDLMGLSGFANPVLTDTAGVVTLSFSTQGVSWSGPGAVWDLKTSNNWLAGSQPFAWGDAVTFDDTVGVPTTVTLTGDLRPSSFSVSSSTNNFTLTGSTGNFIAGSTSLLKSGTSILTMTGPNTFTGGVVISQGAINTQSASALGAGTVALGDANTGAFDTALYIDTSRVNFVRPITVSANGSGTATLGTRSNVGGSGASNGFNGITLARDVIFDSNAADRTDYSNISGTGNITMTGAGRTLFTGTNTFTGNITVNPSAAGGYFQIGTATAGATNYIPDSCNVTVNDFAGASLAEFRLSTGSETINGLNGNGTVNCISINTTLTVGGGNGNGAFSGTIQNGGANTVALTKAGTGVQVLSGTNTYTGVTTINGGVLQFSNPAALYNGNPASWTAANLTVASGATASFNVGGAGEFTVADIDAIRVLSNVASGVTATQGFRNGSLIGLDTTNAGGSLTYSSVITNRVAGTTTDTLGVRKRGTGTLVLSGANTYTGTTFVDAGTLEVTANGGPVMPYTVAQGATLMLGYNRTTNDGDSITVNGNGVADAAGVYLRINNQTVYDRIEMRTAPTTIRSYGGTGTAFLKPDLYSSPISTDAGASGSVIDSSVNIRFVNFTYGGLTFTTAAGANTATGDLIVNGAITGNSNGGFPNNTLYKRDVGSLKLTAANTFSLNGVSSVNIENGSIIAAGGNDRLPTTTVLTLGSGSTSGKLILGDASAAMSQTIVSAVTSGSGTANAIVAGSSTNSTLNLSNSANATMAVKLGGTGTNENNLTLTKSGSGILTLANIGNTYAGGTTVSAGTLRIIDNTGLVAGTGAVTINSGGTLDGYGELFNDVIVSATGGTITGGIGAGSFSGDALTVGSLTFQGTGTVSVLPGISQINVTNALTASGTAGSVVVDIGTPPLASGTYTLITHAGAIAGTGISAFALGTNPGGPFNYALSDNGSELLLTVTTSALFWDGNNGNGWTLANNWRTGSGSPVSFSAGAAVVFNDGASNLNVDISTADVAPGSVTFTNTGGFDYAVGGSNAITGTAALLKSGAGIVSINNTNSFTGNVTINQGTLNAATISNVGTDSALGKGSDITLGGGTLGYTGLAAASTDRPVSVTAPSGLAVNAGDLSLDGVLSGSASLAKSGAGVLSLTNMGNTYSGELSVTGGTVLVDDPSKLGSGSLTLAGGVLALSGSSAITTSKAIALGAGGGTVINTADVTHSGPISGTGGLTKSGLGTLTLSTNKNFTGGVTVNNGTLYLTAGGWYTIPFGGVNTLTINSGGTVETAGAHTLGTDQIPVVINGGTLKLGREQYATNLRMTGGLVTGNSDPSTELRNWGGTMNFYASSAGAVIATRLNLVGDTVLSVEDGAAADDLLVTGPVVGDSKFTKSGDGKLTLQGVNTYTNSTTVSAGTLELKDNARLTFVIPATGSSNQISGAGNAVFDGDFHINITAAAALTTGTWTLEDLTGTATYGLSTFQVVNSDGSPWTVSGSKWTRTSGSQLWTYDTSTGILTLAQAGYESWAALKGLDGTAGKEKGLTDDPDKDGVNNLLEFYFDGGPLANSASALPVPDYSNPNYLKLTFKRFDDAETDTTGQQLQFGSDLTGWVNATVTAADFAYTSGPANGVIITVVENGAAPDDVTISIPRSYQVGGKLFGRVSVTK
jgi:autotransporter-associated beta strand protein